MTAIEPSLRITIFGAASSQNTRSLADAWQRQGAAVEVLSLHGGAWGSIPVRSIAVGGGARPIGYPLYARKASRLTRTARPHVVVGYHITSYGVIASLTELRPLVLIAAGGDVLKEQYGGRLRSLLMPLAARVAIRRADLLCAWGEHLAARLRALGGDGKEIVVLPRGIDLRLFNPRTRDSGKGTENLLLVSTRALKRIYRHDIAIRGVAQARAHGVPVSLILIGEGPERAALEAIRAQNCVEPFVSLPGSLPYSDVAAALRSADVYVSLPNSDGVSASLFEAMASGLFPIVSDIPANRLWIRDGDNGICLDDPTPERLARAIEFAWRQTELVRRAQDANVELVSRVANLEKNCGTLLRRLIELAETRPHAETVHNLDASQQNVTASTKDDGSEIRR